MSAADIKSKIKCKVAGVVWRLWISILICYFGLSGFLVKGVCVSAACNYLIIKQVI